MPDPITPDTVRALIADATDGPWVMHNYGNAGAAVAQRDAPSNLVVGDCHHADAALIAAAPTIANLYLDAIAERDRLREIADDSPPPADAGLLALANRTLAADLETVRAERDRLARVLCDIAEAFNGGETAPEDLAAVIGQHMQIEARRARLDADRAGGSDV